jgi:drug/metabolite transporter (DMT)-like permease
MSKRAKAEALLVVATLIWGSTFVIVKDALKDSSPLPFIAVRFIFAGLVLFAVLPGRTFDRQAAAPGLILGVFLFVGYAFQTCGLVYTSPSKSAFITGFSVILVPVIMLASGIRLRGAALAGGSLGLAGIYFLVLPSGLNSVNRGDVLTLLGSAAFAVHIILVGRYTQRYSFLHLVPTQILSVGLLAAATLPFDPTRRLHWTLRLVVAFLLTAVLATGFAFSVQNWAQQFIPTSHTALIFTLEPVFAALTSRVLLGESPGGKALLGSALVLAGMVISEMWGVSAPSPVES